MKKVVTAIANLRVLIVEDNNLTRVSLASTCLLHGVEQVFEASSAKEAMGIITRNKESNPNVALLDLDLGDGPTGIDLAWGLRRHNPSIGLVILSSYKDPRLTGRKLPELPKYSQYLIKSEVTDTDQLIQALLQSQSQDNSAPSSKSNSYELSDSEINLLRLIWEGHSNSQIGKIKSIAPKSVETAISRLSKKIDVEYSNEINQRILLAKFYQELTGKIN
jgi:DNA-binding NarL/FixJ family response regulator